MLSRPNSSGVGYSVLLETLTVLVAVATPPGPLRRTWTVCVPLASARVYQVY
jgi:hypothetical protein